MSSGFLLQINYITLIAMSRAIVLLFLISSCAAFGNYHSMRRYDSSEEDNTVLRTYRRCMWEQSKYLPRRLVMLSICSNLFCENNQLITWSKSLFALPKTSRPNDCLDILTDQCEQGDENELRYKPFPDCCPVYCNLKRRMNRLKSLHMRYRRLLNTQRQQDQQLGTGSTLLQQGYGGNYK